MFIIYLVIYAVLLLVHHLILENLIYCSVKWFILSSNQMWCKDQGGITSPYPWWLECEWASCANWHNSSSQLRLKHEIKGFLWVSHRTPQGSKPGDSEVILDYSENMENGTCYLTLSRSRKSHCWDVWLASTVPTLGEDCLPSRWHHHIVQCQNEFSRKHSWEICFF